MRYRSRFGRRRVVRGRGSRSRRPVLTRVRIGYRY